MVSDEQAIRSLVATWMQATAAGDLSRVLELMADDVVFLVAGRAPMCSKSEFAAASKAMHARVEATADIKEVRVFGDWAYCWNQLTLTSHPDGGGAPMHRSGPTLSILRRTPDSRWVVFRDANLVGPAK